MARLRDNGRHRDRRESERQKRLLGSGISSQSQVDRAAHAAEAASQELAAAQQLAALERQLPSDQATANATFVKPPSS